MIDALAEDFAQGEIENMRGGVIGHRRVAMGVFDGDGDAVADGNCLIDGSTDVQDIPADRVGFFDFESSAAGFFMAGHSAGGDLSCVVVAVDVADVADLPAGFCIVVGAIENDRNAFVQRDVFIEIAAVPDGADDGGNGFVFILVGIVSGIDVQMFQPCDGVGTERELLGFLDALAAGGAGFFHERLRNR